mgnify:CR=1 FL=1
MTFTRRDLVKLAAAALPGAAGLLAKPNSQFHGVQIGVITYSFRSLKSGAEETLKYCVDCGISGIELMSNVAEGFAGVPAAAGGGAGRGKMQPTPEMLEARKKATEEVTKWRTSVSMDKFKAFRRMYEDAGVKIYAFKLPPTMEMSDAEYEYIWNVAETVGANHITMELPTDWALTQRVGEYAAKRKLAIAFHTHGQGADTQFDKALAISKYTAINFDVGHFWGVNGLSPVPVIERYHDRISSLHLKDRKGPKAASETRGPGGGGPNVSWGDGETPLKEILQLLKQKKYKIPASIEYEYDTPQGSDELTEIKKCVDFCKKALA